MSGVATQPAPRSPCEAAHTCATVDSGRWMTGQVAILMAMGIQTKAAYTFRLQDHSLHIAATNDLEKRIHSSARRCRHAMQICSFERSMFLGSAVFIESDLILHGTMTNIMDCMGAVKTPEDVLKV